jgi:hypothetical protein
MNTTDQDTVLRAIMDARSILAEHSADFHPRSARGSGASRQSRATGTNFATYCIISSRP